MTIYTITECKGKFKVLPCKLVEFWPEGTCVKINNKCDKTETPLPEETIRNQILAAENSKRKWHNTEHFAYYCRYGPVVNNVRMRKVSKNSVLNSDKIIFTLKKIYLYFMTLRQH